MSDVAAMTLCVYVCACNYFLLSFEHLFVQYSACVRHAFVYMNMHALCMRIVGKHVWVTVVACTCMLS